MRQKWLIFNFFLSETFPGRCGCESVHELQPIGVWRSASSHHAPLLSAVWPSSCSCCCCSKIKAALLSNMSAVLFLKTSLSRLPPRVARQVVGCCYYHTKQGVYGYRPKQTESQLQYQVDRIAALNQGQHGVNSRCGWVCITRWGENVDSYYYYFVQNNWFTFELHRGRVCVDIEAILCFLMFLCSDHGLARLVEAYRAHGHKAAKINPLLPQKPVADSVPEIDVLKETVRGQLNTSGNYNKHAAFYYNHVLLLRYM